MPKKPEKLWAWLNSKDQKTLLAILDIDSPRLSWSHYNFETRPGSELSAELTRQAAGTAERFIDDIVALWSGIKPLLPSKAEEQCHG